MNRNTSIELLVSALLVIVAVLLVNPFHFWMPDMAHMAILGCLLVVFAALATFILRERAVDERETAHRMLAGRSAFLLGSFVLVLGIATQTFQDALDPWLVGALVIMVVAKIATRIYVDWKR